MAMRVERFGQARLILGDCREVLDDFDRIKDAVISDPPYGIGHVKGASKTGIHAKLRNGAHTFDKGRPIIGDDRPFDPAHILRFSNVLIWGADHYSARLPETGRWLAWNKLGQLEAWDSFSDVEFAWHSGKGASRIFTMLWKGLAAAKSGEENGQRFHPTMKPLRLMHWCIEQAALTPRQMIVDPYMGSGSTGVAALEMNHPFTGIEIDEVHFDTACRRIEARAEARETAPNLL